MYSWNMETISSASSAGGTTSKTRGTTSKTLITPASAPPSPSFSECWNQVKFGIEHETLAAVKDCKPCHSQPLDAIRDMINDYNSTKYGRTFEALLIEREVQAGSYGNGMVSHDMLSRAPTAWVLKSDHSVMFDGQHVARTQNMKELSSLHPDAVVNRTTV
jgi:hypothetical protein